jgi:hypothetical protein
MNMWLWAATAFLVLLFPIGFCVCRGTAMQRFAAFQLASLAVRSRCCCSRAIGLAASALTPKERFGGIRMRIETPLRGPQSFLRGIHSGVFPDYVAWIVAGAAALSVALFAAVAL